MKYSNLKSFKKHLKDSASRSLLPSYLVIAKDPLEQKEVLQVFLDVTQLEFPQKTFKGSSLSLDELRLELETASFFSQQTNIVVVWEGELLKKIALNYLQDYLSNPMQSKTVVIFSTSSLSKPVKSLIEKHGAILEIPEPKPWEKEQAAMQWLLAKAQSYNKQLSSPAALQLIKQMGRDKTLLVKELEKLVSYIGERNEVSKEDVILLGGSQPLESIWDFTDGLQKRNSAQTLHVGYQLLNSGESLIAILSQLRQQFQMGLTILSLIEKGRSKEDIQKYYPFLKGKLLERKVEMAKSFGMWRYKKALQLVFEKDLEIRSSSMDQKTVLCLLVEEILNLRNYSYA
jgi:DNA polymerase III subunit delta